MEKTRPIDELNKEIIKTYEKIDLTEDIKLQNELFKKIENIETKLNYWEYYSAESSLLKIIAGMNINDEMLYQSLNKLSGGQRIFR